MAQKILLIEDDEQVRNMYQLAFEAQGFLCKAAKSGPEGLEFARADKPDLILLDIMMPNVDGIAVLGEIKKDANLSSIPVIMLSNLSIQEGIDKAMQLGARDYVNKSLVKPRDVVEKVKSYLSQPPTPTQPT